MNRFTLATVQSASGPLPALGVDGQYYPLADLQPSLGGATVRSLLESWAASFPVLEKLAGEAAAASAVARPEADLLTPILYPNKLMAVGANYSGHLKEMGHAVQKYIPMPFFFRAPNVSLVGPGETVRIPRNTKQFDWECELAIVVGKRLRHASREEAAEAIVGYTTGLDMSCRDLIVLNNDLKLDLTRGKCQETMAPCGPHIVPKEFMPDVRSLKIRLWVNDQLMMDANTDEMIFQVDEILSEISDNVTIDPGDIIFTGSPAGSAGHHGNCWLKEGDRIRAEIDGIGPLNISMVKD